MSTGNENVESLRNTMGLVFDSISLWLPSSPRCWSLMPQNRNCADHVQIPNILVISLSQSVQEYSHGQEHPGGMRVVSHWYQLEILLRHFCPLFPFRKSLCIQHPCALCMHFSSPDYAKDHVLVKSNTLLYSRTK